MFASQTRQHHSQLFVLIYGCLPPVTLHSLPVSVTDHHYEFKCTHCVTLTNPLAHRGSSVVHYKCVSGCCRRTILPGLGEKALLSTHHADVGQLHAERAAVQLCDGVYRLTSGAWEPPSVTKHPGAKFTPRLQDGSAGKGRQKVSRGPGSQTLEAFILAQRCTPATLKQVHTHTRTHTQARACICVSFRNFSSAVSCVFSIKANISAAGQRC